MDMKIITPSCTIQGNIAQFTLKLKTTYSTQIFILPFGSALL